MKRITWINLIAGLWLIAAPFVLGYSTSAIAVAEDVTMGILVAAFSWWILAAMAPPVGAAWFQILSGIWIIVAPFALVYGLPTATYNDVLFGILVLVIGAIESRAVAAPRPMA